MGLVVPAKCKVKRCKFLAFRPLLFKVGSQAAELASPGSLSEVQNLGLTCTS